MLVIPIVAWGEHHIRMAQYCLASLMSEGNLPDVEAHVKIYTDEPARFKGYQTAAFRRTGGKHQITTNCYVDALREGYPIVPISADMIASVGMLAALEKHAKTKRLVTCPVLRTDSSKVVPILEGMLQKNIPLAPMGRISLTQRESCAIAMENLHPRLMLQFMDSLPAISYPTTIYRRNGNTIAARCFHMHPILLFPGDIRHVTASIDGEMVSKFTDDQIHVVTDSDEMVVFDVTEPDYNWNGVVKDTVETLEFVNRKTVDRHRWFFTHESYLHSGDLERLPPEPRMDKLLADVAALPSR